MLTLQRLLLNNDSLKLNSDRLLEQFAKNRVTTTTKTNQRLRTQSSNDIKSNTVVIAKNV